MSGEIGPNILIFSFLIFLIAECIIFISSLFLFLVVESKKIDNNISVNMGSIKNTWDKIPLSKEVDTMNIPIKIISGSTVREVGGLAMSSRNVYLTSEQKKSAGKQLIDLPHPLFLESSVPH